MMACLRCLDTGIDREGGKCWACLHALLYSSAQIGRMTEDTARRIVAEAITADGISISKTGELMFVNGVREAPVILEPSRTHYAARVTPAAGPPRARSIAPPPLSVGGPNEEGAGVPSPEKLSPPLPGPRKIPPPPPPRRK